MVASQYYPTALVWNPLTYAIIYDAVFSENPEFIKEESVVVGQLRSHRRPVVAFGQEDSLVVRVGDLQHFYRRGKP